MPARLINEERAIANILGFGENYARIVKHINIISGLIASIFVMSGLLITMILTLNMMNFEDIYLWSNIIGIAFIILGMAINYRESIKEKRKLRWSYCRNKIE